MRGTTNTPVGEDVDHTCAQPLAITPILNQAHCPRGRWWNPVFGERFSGPNYPLTKALALQGLDIQPPLDKLVPDLPWDFFEEEGKKRLRKAEDEPDLLVSHWGPECKTFSRSRGHCGLKKSRGASQM